MAAASSSHCTLADHGAELAGVDKQHLTGAAVLALGEEPEAGGDLGVEEQLARQATMHSTTSASTMRARISPRRSGSSSWSRWPARYRRGHRA